MLQEAFGQSGRLIIINGNHLRTIKLFRLMPLYIHHPFLQKPLDQEKPELKIWAKVMVIVLNNS